MPRPYGLILGEGTYKFQRGLGDTMSLSAADIADSGVESSFCYDVSKSPWNIVDCLTGALVGTTVSSVNMTTLGAWLKQNQTLLLIGGAIGLFLWGRR